MSEANFKIEQTAKLAYRLWEEGGRSDGHDIEDWLTAEAAVKEQQAQQPEGSLSKPTMPRSTQMQ